MLRISSEDKFLQDLNSVHEAEDHRIFKERATTFLKDHNHALHFHLLTGTVNREKQEKLFTLFGKIRENIETTRYAVTRFDSGRLGQNIPVLELIPERAENKAFIHPPRPTTQYSIKSKQDVDELVSIFSEMDIPWDAPEGCDERAEISCRLLTSMNIPEDRIKKIWISRKTTNFFVHTLSDTTVCWTWHIAPLVRTSRGDQYVIDLFFSKREALSPNHWTQEVSGGRPFNLGIMDGKYTCDMKEKKEILVTDEIFEKFAKRTIAHNIISRAPLTGLPETVLTQLLPQRPNLTLDIEASDLKTTSLNEHQFEKDNSSCSCSIS